MTVGFEPQCEAFSGLSGSEQRAEVFCENRIKIRVLNGGHNIPKNDIIRRFYRSKENFWNTYKDLVDEWNLFYNGTSEYILVAQSSESKIEIYNENLYNEFIKDFQ